MSVSPVHCGDFLRCETLKRPFLPCFLSTVVWTETSSRSSRSSSSSPTPNWDACEYTFLTFPSLHPEFSLSLPLSISSDVLRDPSICVAALLRQNFYRGWGFKSLAVATQCCSVLLWGGEKECVSASVRPIFKRWKGAWSECLAWTCEEFLFRNTSFPEWKSRSDGWREDSYLLFSLSSSLLSWSLSGFFICLILRESLPAEVKGWNTYTYIAVFIGLPSKPHAAANVCI